MAQQGVKRKHTDMSEVLDFGGPIYRVSVRHCTIPFKIHLSVLRSSSASLRNATKPEWESSRPACDQGQVDLTELVDESHIFNIYVYWLYSGKLPIKPETPVRTTQEKYCALAKAYVLGEVLIDIQFKNAVIDAIITLSEGRDHPGTGMVKIIYADITDDMPREFLVDALRAVTVCRRGLASVAALMEDGGAKTSARYHEHTDT